MFCQPTFISLPKCKLESSNSKIVFIIFVETETDLVGTSETDVKPDRQDESEEGAHAHTLTYGTR